MPTPAHRAARTAQNVRLFRAIGMAKPRRGRLPRWSPPVAIERGYAAAVLQLVGRLRPLFDHALRELQPIVEHARRVKLDGLRTDAGEGARARAVIERLRAAMSHAIAPAAVEDLARKFAVQTSTHQRMALAGELRAALGVDVFISDTRLIPLVEAFVDANVGLIRSIGDQLANRVEGAVLSAVQNGRLWPDLAKDLEKYYDFGEERARLVARDQILTLHADIDQARQRELGVKRFRWVNVNDDRVRDDHERLGDPGASGDENIYEYDDPPLNDKGEPVMPGDEPLCRCRAQGIYSDILADLDE